MGGADGCGSASDRDVLEERRLRAGYQLVLGYADAADCAAGPPDLDCRLHRLVEADALEHCVDAVAVGQFLDALDRLGPSFADDVGRAELARERNPLLVAAQDDDPHGAESLGGDHAAELDAPVAGDGSALSGPAL